VARDESERERGQRRGRPKQSEKRNGGDGKGERKREWRVMRGRKHISREKKKGL
jgi:hypothetical protein